MFKKLKLKNGLTLILDQNKDVHTATATIYVNVGGNDVSFEVDGKKYNVEHGIAHLLEHYLIENSIYGNISEIFSDEFIKTNGGTSHKETCYYLSTVHHFKQNFIKLLNVVNNPNFTAEKLDAVKQPIIQEIRMYADKLENLTDRNYWPFPTYSDILFSVQ